MGQFDGWTTENFIEEIKKLRKENGDRRAKAKVELDNYTELAAKKDEEIVKLASTLESTNNDYEKLQKETSAEQFIPLSSVELLKKQYADEKSTLESDYTKVRHDLAQAHLMKKVYNLIYTKGYKFKNEHERKGFEVTILSNKEDGSPKSEDDVQLEVNNFLKDNYKHVSLPPAGQVPNKADYAGEIARLLNKPTLTPEEIRKVHAYEALIEQNRT